MKLKFRLPSWLLGVLVLSLLGTGGYVAYSQVTTAQRQQARRNLQTATVERQTLPLTISANGTVQPERSVNVSPKSSGILKELLVKEGDRVQAGQILARMDDSNLQGQLLQAQANLASAQANLDKLLAGNRPQEVAQAQAQLAAAQANLDKLVAGNRPQEVAQAQAQLTSAQANLRQAELTFNQNQQLYSTGAISQRELDTSRTALDTAKAQVDQARQALNLQQSGTRPEEIAAARAQVEQLRQALSLQRSGSRPEDIAAAQAQVLNAEGALKTVQTQINDTVIRAPFSGVITRKFADPGAFVTPTTSSSSESSATSSSILALASTNRVEAKVAETSIPKIKVGLPVSITADAYPNQTFQGQVVQVATQSTVEQNVTNFEVKTSVIDPKNLLQSGMNVNVEFKVGMLNDALVIPTVAIVRQEQGTGVYVTGQGGNRPHFQPITTGATIDDKTVVASGLKAGDRILLSFPQGERPASRTPSVFPGMGGGPPGGGGGRRGGG
ncbi:MAG TPA: efflux RND transporter periplasmic adaptor subunit [Microcoleaceae cyanobacterium]